MPRPASQAQMHGQARARALTPAVPAVGLVRQNGQAGVSSHCSSLDTALTDLTQLRRPSPRTAHAHALAHRQHTRHAPHAAPSPAQPSPRSSYIVPSEYSPPSHKAALAPVSRLPLSLISAHRHHTTSAFDHPSRPLTPTCNPALDPGRRLWGSHRTRSKSKCMPSSEP
jgi:hypothetical protein